MTRLDKYLCDSTDLSRSLAKIALRRGRVSVNGEPTKQASLQIAEGDEVRLDGERIERPGLRYFMMNKPAGYVCSAEDDNHPSVLSLLGEEHWGSLHFAGRLDADTTGLLLVTDDGQWSHQVTSPRRACQKHYRADLAEPIAESDVEAFEKGLMLRGEEKATLPAKLFLRQDDEPTRADVIISEGRYHQVKRMFAACNNRVVALKRLAIGDLQLDASLAEGDWRPLSEDEIEQAVRHKPA